MGFCIDGDFFNCSEVVIVTKNYEKKKGKKKRVRGTRAMNRREKSRWIESMLLRE